MWSNKQRISSNNSGALWKTLLRFFAKIVFELKIKCIFAIPKERYTSFNKEYS